jgi:dethiobiotin synthetase
LEVVNESDRRGLQRGSLTVTTTKRIIVLGTGTGVGKTWITIALAHALRRLGVSVVALKPVETGVGSDSASEASDASLLASASSRAPAPAPFTFRDPVSPHLAARRVGRSIDVSTIREYVVQHENEATSSVTSFVLVESAGACLSPLGPGLTNTDLAIALEPAIWILVAPDSLGVLHDVSATLAALTSRKRLPDHVVLSTARASDASTGTNGAELRELGIVTPSAIAPRGDERSLDGLAETLVQQAKRPGKS